jgi:leucyl-tRNA synthetase
MRNELFGNDIPSRGQWKWEKERAKKAIQNYKDFEEIPQPVRLILKQAVKREWRHLAKERIELVLQINGKLRGKIEVAADADKAAIEAVAIDAAQAMHNGGSTPSRGDARPRVIIVPNRLVNVVMPKNAA